MVTVTNLSKSWWVDTHLGLLRYWSILWSPSDCDVLQCSTVILHTVEKATQINETMIARGKTMSTTIAPSQLGGPGTRPTKPTRPPKSKIICNVKQRSRVATSSCNKGMRCWNWNVLLVTFFNAFDMSGVAVEKFCQEKMSTLSKGKKLYIAGLPKT